MRGSTFSIAVLLSIGLSGCVWDDMVATVRAGFGDNSASPAASAAVDPVSLTGPNAIPWQLTPASAASIGQGEVTFVADKPNVGRVRGTERALAQLDQRIVPFVKDERVVQACKTAFEWQAKKAGAYSVEAAAAGPRQKVATGWNQQVFFRIWYSDPKDAGVEVRQASIGCTVDTAGQLVKATVI